MEVGEKMKTINPCCLCRSETLKLWRAVIGGGKHHVECDICHNCGPIAFTHLGAIKTFIRRKRK